MSDIAEIAANTGAKRKMAGIYEGWDGRLYATDGGGPINTGAKTMSEVTQADRDFADRFSDEVTGLYEDERVSLSEFAASHREQALAPWVEAVEELRQYLQFEVNSFSRPNDIAWLAKIDALLAAREDRDAG